MKFLIVQFRQIGDVVLTTAMIRLLKENMPDARIDFLTFDINRSLLIHHPLLDELITIDRNLGTLSFLKFLREIRKRRYDAVLDFQNTPRSMYCVIASGAPHKVTYETSSRKIFYNTRVQHTGSYPTTTKSNLLKPFVPGLAVSDTAPPRPEIFYPDTDVRWVEKKMAAFGISPEDFLVIIAPTHHRETRRWPLDNFYAAARHLIDGYGAKVVLSYGPGEIDYIRQSRGFANADQVTLITDLELDLLQMAILMRKAKIMLGNCSAPNHMATSQGLPTFIIYGSTSPGWSYPSGRHVGLSRGMDCQPCNRNVCLYGDAIPCLKSFTFEEIRGELDRFIEHVTRGREGGRLNCHRPG